MNSQADNRKTPNLIRMNNPNPVTTSLTKLARSEHPVSRSEIPNSALNVLYRLHNKGFQAYLVGGCIRDRLLGKKPKDFDVVTNATPEEVKNLFRNSRIIGRRFRIVHVRYGREIIEVTTFRGKANAEHQDRKQTEAGMLLQDNVWGKIEEDVLRRDFTVNALYYNISDFAIYDYVGGLQDLHQKTLRLIGDPATRYREDPVRMLRALRFAAKLDFKLDPATAAPIQKQANLLLQVPPARMFDEVLKLLLSGQAVKTFQLLNQYGLLAFLFPASYEALKLDPAALQVIQLAMRNTDARIQEDKPVTPAFLFAILLWPALIRVFNDLQAKGVPAFHAMQQAGNRVIQRQNQHTSIPKRFAFPMRDIWELQLKLPQRQGAKAWQLLHSPRFRAGYDFMLLREQAGEATLDVASWWTRFQAANEAEQQQMIKALGNSSTSNRKKRAPRRRKNTLNSTSNS